MCVTKIEMLLAQMLRKGMLTLDIIVISHRLLIRYHHHQSETGGSLFSNLEVIILLEAGTPCHLPVRVFLGANGGHMGIECAQKYCLVAKSSSCTLLKLHF